jgi:membrane associated rhomboid family serine protease
MFNNLGPAVKNIIIINVLVYLACFAVPQLRDMLSGYFYQSPNFRPWQLVTHMFTHAPSISHIFFNMYGLFIFGSALERYWGSKRFLIYYFVCGFGAFFLHEAINYVEIQNLISQLSPLAVQEVFEEGAGIIREGKNYTDPGYGALNAALNVGVVGASGCVFGVLLAFGMMFPNTELMLLFPPIPLKAKWFVMIYGAIELMLALQNSPGDNVAHYAHLGGMIFGFILLKIWKKRDGSLYGNNNFY